MNKRGEGKRHPSQNYFVCEHCDLEFDDLDEVEKYNSEYYCLECGEELDIE